MENSLLGLMLSILCASLGSYWINQRRFKVPPGPPTMPLIGNLMHMPSELAYVTFNEWARKYNSDILSLNGLGYSIIILCSLEAVNDLLDKRSLIYSSRPRMPMAGELMGWGWSLPLRPYGEAWRVRRRLTQSEFDAKPAARFRPQQAKACHGLLDALLDSPESWHEHLRHHTASVIMDVIYGIDILPSNDPYVEAAEKGVASVSVAAKPGTFLVDFFPLLRHVPSWMPGAGFHKIARESRILADFVRDAPFAEVKDAMANGTAKPSFCSYALQNIDKNQDISAQELVISETAGTTYAAAADTTVAALSTFFLAMVKYPVVQANGHAELDKVLGRNQLPNFNDEDSLPYITAISMEVLRWQSVTPLAIPRLSTKDDVYKGYHIPKGSIIFPNAWAILHDEKQYPDSFEFKPERFLKDGKLDKSVQYPSAAFGFGRRICPGQHMARASIWITVSSILATFNIDKAVDAQGNTIDPPVNYMDGIVSQPRPFQCKISPRSKETEKMIKMVI